MKLTRISVGLIGLSCVLTASAELTPAQRQACQSAYSTAVSQCATGLSFLEPNTRAGAQKSCVQTAQLTRAQCLQGTPPPTCQESCQAAYANTAAVCEITFDPARCPSTDLFCQQLFTSLRADCLAAATNTLNACVAACPPQ